MQEIRVTEGTIHPREFVVAFVYTRPCECESVVVNGKMHDVEKYIHDNFVVALVHFKRPLLRMPSYKVIGIHGDKQCRITASKGRAHSMNILRIVDRVSGHELFQKSFRRMPQRWPKELESFLPVEIRLEVMQSRQKTLYVPDSLPSEQNVLINPRNSRTPRNPNRHHINLIFNSNNGNSINLTLDSNNENHINSYLKDLYFTQE